MCQLDLFDESSTKTYINDSAERADRIRSVEDVAAHGCILHDGARDHDDIVGGAGHLLEDEVNHLAEGGILVLEQLRDAEEEVGCFVLGEFLSSKYEESDLCEEDAAFPR